MSSLYISPLAVIAYKWNLSASRVQRVRLLFAPLEGNDPVPIDMTFLDYCTGRSGGACQINSQKLAHITINVHIPTHAYISTDSELKDLGINNLRYEVEGRGGLGLIVEEIFVFG